MNEELNVLWKEWGHKSPDQQLNVLWEEWGQKGPACIWTFIDRIYPSVDWAYGYAQDNRAYWNGMRAVQDFVEIFALCVDNDRARALQFVRDRVGKFEPDNPYNPHKYLWRFFKEHER